MVKTTQYSTKNNTRFPPDSKWLFPEYEFETMTVDQHQGVVIERILERGSWSQIRWLLATYGELQVSNWVMEHGFRLLSKRSFALWRLVLNIEEYKAPAWVIEAKEIGI